MSSMVCIEETWYRKKSIPKKELNWEMKQKLMQATHIVVLWTTQRMRIGGHIATICVHSRLISIYPFTSGITYGRIKQKIKWNKIKFYWSKSKWNGR